MSRRPTELRSTRWVALVFAAAALLALPVARIAHAAVGFDGGLETASYRPWDSVQHEGERPLDDSFQVVTDTVRQGRYAAKMMVRQGYSAYGYGEDTELDWDSNEHEGDDYWYAWSTLFPTDWSAPYSWGIFAQWHAKLGTSPALAFDARQDSAYVQIHGGDTNTATNSFAVNRQIEFLPTLSKGKWNDFVVHVHWSASDTGLVQVWHRVAGDGSFAKLVDVQNVATLQRTSAGTASNYTLWGLYRGSYCSQPTQLGCTGPLGTQPTTVVYQDGFSRGGSFDEVVASAFGGGSAPVQQPSPPQTPATPATQGQTAPAPSAPELSVPGGLSPVVDSGCASCRAAIDGATVQARIGGGDDRFDTAYGIEDFGGASGSNGTLYVRDAIGLGRGQSLGANVAVLQVLDTSRRILFELYVSPDRQLRLWSAAGSLGATTINQGTGVVVPNDGSSIRAEVAARANDSVVVRVDGLDRITVSGLSGATTGPARYLVAGIDHYDTATTAEPVAVDHADVAVGTSGWLGGRAAPTAATGPTAAGAPSGAAAGAPASAAAKPGTGTTAATGKLAPATLGGSTTRAKVVWENLAYLKPKALRLRLAAEGVAWNAFLAKHPSVASAFALVPLTWDDRPVFTRTALSKALARYGMPYAHWAKSHRAAAAVLTRNDTAAGIVFPVRPKRVSP